MITVSDFLSTVVIQMLTYVTLLNYPEKSETTVIPLKCIFKLV